MEKTVETWFVYIVECADGSFYTGSTNNVEARITKHNTGKGAKYTRGRLPVKLVYIEECIDRSSAVKREEEIKKMGRREKESFICNDNSLKSFKLTL